jgi:NTP pyrophosphatase (non-canonical NTP hydrolase)
MKDIEQKVIQWATERQIYEHSTSQAQVLKAVSEIGELADASIKADRDALIDAIGDVMVCLTNVAFMAGTDLTACFNRAWDEIKDRKGFLSPNGAFVKVE